jgi:hypothetical protein
MNPTDLAETRPEIYLHRIQRLLLIFMILLVLSGLTAFPLQTELSFLNSIDFLPKNIATWISKVYIGLKQTNATFPFLAYGTDWLAFAHLAIAVFFIGPLKDPVRNKWILQAGMIISVGIFPLAFIAGNIRNIPFYWQLIDCSFGIFSFLLLNYCLNLTWKLEQLQSQQALSETAEKLLLNCPFHQPKNVSKQAS